MLPDYLNDYYGTPCQPEAEGHYDAWIERIAAEEFPLSDNKPANDRRSSSGFIPNLTNSTSGSSVASPPSLYRSRSDGSDTSSESDSDAPEIVLHLQEAPVSCPESPIAADTGHVKKVPVRSSSHDDQATARPGTGQFSRLYALPDGETEDSSDGGATDEEYIPPLTISHPRKRRRTTSPEYHSKRAPNISPAEHRHSSKRIRLPPAPRNKQATDSSIIDIASSGTGSGRCNFICPACGWKQSNQRMPDFKRHLRTHTRPSDEEKEKGWWCKGVLYDHATDYNIAPGSQPYLFLNQLRIGGCVRSFSRRDALKRHLDNENVTCVGKPCEATEE